MRYLPIVLLIGIVSNFLCLVIFRLKLDRKYEYRFNELATTLQNQLVSFSSDALGRIDSYVKSNIVERSSFPPSDSPSPVENDPKSVLFVDSGECDYYYYVYNGSPVARIGISDFRVGNPFPRGGAITAIFPDFLIVDNSLSFRNRSYTPYSSSISYASSRPAVAYENSSKPVKQYQPKKELNDVKRTN